MDTARIHVSLSVTNYSWPGGPQGLAGHLADIAVAGDEAGLDTLWVADHLLQADPNATADSEMLEAYTALGFLAARTGRIRLGSMVSAATFRAPALLIKAVTTLDVLSGGRLARRRRGLSGGRGPRDGPAAPAHRRTVRATPRNAGARAADVVGRELAVQGAPPPPRPAVSNPPALHKPHPPILIGGMGERKTLRLVARYADACNLFDIPDGGRTIKHKLEILARHCHAVPSL
jgi:alkanesulfonate monooxygenase SsuD/methylene tetrahydromethanopterin reductase-like flavin-dependent oxidoreductase (luciferase family)